MAQAHTHTHTSRPYKHTDVHQRVGLHLSRSGQQQVPFHPKNKTKHQCSLSTEQPDRSRPNTLTRWADSVSCCGGCLCSFSGNWTGTANKVSALLCPSLREQPCYSDQEASTRTGSGLFFFLFTKHTCLISVPWAATANSISSLPKMLDFFAQIGDGWQLVMFSTHRQWSTETWRLLIISTPADTENKLWGLCKKTSVTIQSLYTFACRMYEKVICHCNLSSRLSSDTFIKWPPWRK